MELKLYMAILRKRIRLITGIMIFVLLAASIYSFFLAKPVYKAECLLIIGNYSKDSNTTKTDYNDILMYQTMVKTYSELAKSRKIAEDVISNLSLNVNPEVITNSISVTPESDTEFITLSIKYGNPKLAADIANQTAKSLKSIGADIRKSDNIYIVDEAIIPSSPFSPNKIINLAIAFFLGLALSFGISFLLEYIDSTVKGSEELEQLIDIPVIGSIPLFVKKQGGENDNE